jgi:hypothetical protein
MQLPDVVFLLDPRAIESLQGLAKLKEAMGLRAGMELKQRKIAGNLEVDLRGFEDDADQAFRQYLSLCFTVKRHSVFFA